MRISKHEREKGKKKWKNEKQTRNKKRILDKFIFDEGE